MKPFRAQIIYRRDNLPQNSHIIHDILVLSHLRCCCTCPVDNGKLPLATTFCFNQIPGRLPINQHHITRRAPLFRYIYRYSKLTYLPCKSMTFSSNLAASAPANFSIACSPSKSTNVGTAEISKSKAASLLSSTSTFPKATPSYFLESSSYTGAIALHGGHQLFEIMER